MKIFSVSRWDSNRGFPDLIHDELDHRATVPCHIIKVIYIEPLSIFLQTEDSSETVNEEEELAPFEDETLR